MRAPRAADPDACQSREPEARPNLRRPPKLTLACPRAAGAALIVAVLLLSTLVLIVRSPAASASPYEAPCPTSPYDAICMYYDASLRGANLGVNTNVPNFAKPATYFPRDCSYWQNPSPNDCAGQGVHSGMTLIRSTMMMAYLAL